MELENLDVVADNNHFQQLFLDENPAIFQNAYPAVAFFGDRYQVVEDAIKVLPATAVSSKANPGFIAKNHGVFDTLIDSFCAEKFNYSYDPSNLKALADGIDSRVESYSSFYSKHGDKYHSHAVTSRLLTRVGINRRRATAAEDILYSVDINDEPDISLIIQTESVAIKTSKVADIAKVVKSVKTEDAKTLEPLQKSQPPQAVPPKNVEATKIDNSQSLKRPTSAKLPKPIEISKPEKPIAFHHKQRRQNRQLFPSSLQVHLLEYNSNQPALLNYQFL